MERGRMIGRDLRAWRARMGWTQATAAQKLRYSRRQYIRHEQSERPIPEVVQRICQTIETE